MNYELCNYVNEYLSLCSFCFLNYLLTFLVLAISIELVHSAVVVVAQVTETNDANYCMFMFM